MNSKNFLKSVGPSSIVRPLKSKTWIVEVKYTVHLTCTTLHKPVFIVSKIGQMSLKTTTDLILKIFSNAFNYLWIVFNLVFLIESLQIQNIQAIKVLLFLLPWSDQCVHILQSYHMYNIKWKLPSDTAIFSISLSFLIYLLFIYGISVGIFFSQLKKYDVLISLMSILRNFRNSRHFSKIIFSFLF